MDTSEKLQLLLLVACEGLLVSIMIWMANMPTIPWGWLFMGFGTSVIGVWRIIALVKMEIDGNE